ncbi:MAG: cytochrome C oxidase subunit IV family protein [Chloroflexi bacterium]|nr:cytochrome C oxidase subunit IV family protein [Chloroflexota bacterium]
MTTHIQRAHPVEHEAHPGPGKYAMIAVVLAIVTAIEVGVYYIEAIRNLLVPILLVLSAGKFVLVVMYYMHLKFDHRLFTALFVGGLFIATSTILALMALFGAFIMPAAPHA